MNIRIKYSNGFNNPILLSILILGFIEPAAVAQQAELVGGIWHIIHIFFLADRYLSLLIIIVFTIQYLHRFLNSFLIILLLYLSWIVLANVFSGNGISTIKLFVRIFSLYLLLSVYMEIGHFAAITGAFRFWLELFFGINLLTQLIYPTGCYFDDRGWTMWFLGNRNTFIYTYFLLLFFATINELMKSSIPRFRYYVLVILLLFSLLKSQSVTSSIAMIIITGLILLGRNTKFSKYRLTIYAFLVSSAISFALITSGVNTRVSNLIETYLQRNADFTGRAGIWKHALIDLQGNMLKGLGWSEISVEWDWQVFQCHNMYLDILYVGGFILLLLFVGLTFLALKKLDKRKATISDNLFSFFMIGYSIVFLMEARRDDISYIVLLMMLYYSDKILRKPKVFVLNSSENH